MINNVTIAQELNYLTMPEGLLVDIEMINRYPKEKMTIITTGSQGEPMSALARMAFSDHRQVEVGPDDYIIISATPIPGEITRSEARSIADGKLKATYGGFGEYSYSVESNRFNSMPGYDEPVYRLVYYAKEQHAYTCIVGAKSGKVLYHTDVWNPADTEIDYSEPEPTPDYSGSEKISQSRARSIADSTLARKYPEFAGAEITSVSEKLKTEGGSFETPYYQFDYFINGQLAYTCIVHAVTEKILYTFGDLPGEANG